MLCGLPYSGKSTFVQTTQFKDWNIVSSDNILLQIAKELNSTYDDIYARKYKDAEAQMNTELSVYTRNRENIVLDRTHLSVASRNKMIEKVGRRTYSFIAIYFPKVSPKTLQDRMTKRKNQHVPISVIESMEMSYTLPGYGEGFDWVTSADNFIKTNSVMEFRK